MAFGQIKIANGDNFISRFIRDFEDVGGFKGLWNDFTGKTVNQQNIDYQNEYNDTVWNREDTTYQRTVADLEAAGLSKNILGNGGQVIQSHSSSSAPEARQTSGLDKMLSVMSLLSQFASTRAGIQASLAQADKSSAEADNIRKDTEWVDRMNESTILTHSAQVGYNLALTKLYEIQGKYETQRLEEQIKNISAQTFKFLAEREQIQENTNYISKNYSLNVNRYYLDKSVGESQILRNTSQNSYTEAQIANLAQQNAESIARSNHLDQQTKNLVFELTYGNLKYNVDLYNAIVSFRSGLRTNDSAKGVVQSVVTQIGNLGFNFLHFLVGKAGNADFFSFLSQSPTSQEPSYGESDSLIGSSFSGMSPGNAFYENAFDRGR